ncbi:MAG TPA: hypothetical protein VHK70_04475 [Burkholderiaceae bacterium]|jgi:hypothetical protein|nr:hypothetical protein [Burkholderiaceae bacterium]
MAHTVVGVYENYRQAKEALGDLIRNGFSIKHANLSPRQDTNEAREAALREQHQPEGGFTGTIGGFFHSLFSTPEKYRHTDIYSEAVRRGAYLLAVYADTDEQFKRATEIMKRYEPVNIDHRAADAIENDDSTGGGDVIR